MKPNKPRCAKLRNWKPPKPTEDFLICMNSGRRLSLSAPEDAFKVNAIIHCSERLTDSIVKARAFQKTRNEDEEIPFWPRHKENKEN